MTDYQNALLKAIHEYHDKALPIVHHINPRATDHVHDEEFLEVLEIVKAEGYTVTEDKLEVPSQSHLATLSLKGSDPCSIYQTVDANMLVGGMTPPSYYHNLWKNGYPHYSPVLPLY